MEPDATATEAATDAADSLPAPSAPTPLTPPALAPEHYRSGMLRRFGPVFYALGLGVVLRRLRLEEHSAEQVRLAAERGPLVYVMHTRSLIDWLALNSVLKKRRLPMARYSNGITSVWFGPLADAIAWSWRALRGRTGGTPAPDPVESGWLASRVAEGTTTALFLVEPQEIPNPLARPPSDPIPALLAAQERCNRPVQVVPVVVLWKRNPDAARGEVGQFLLGSADEPSPLQKLYAVATRNSDALVQVGEPVDLRVLLARYEGESERRRVRTLRILLRRYLYRESHVVRGPRIRPYRWTRRLVMASPEVTRLIRDEAAATSTTPGAIAVKVERTLDHIAARFSFPMVRMADHLTRFIFTRIYAGVDIGDEDLQKIRAALRAGTPVLVPCHRSHLDYLLVSSILFQHDIVIPHVVAGENLSFFPLGAIFRRCGAFFIRRSFKGDRIFPAVFDRYLRQLVRDGFPVEFFIEGGRSRTGKLLPAKTGVLAMTLDAAGGVRDDREVTFLPIGISYEQIAEGQSYARELAGEKKKGEDIGQVVRAGGVLRKRFGKVFLRVGEPLTAREIFAGLPGPWEQLDREHRREALQQTGERLMYRISRCLVALPTQIVAAALLSQSKRGVRVADLHARAGRFHELLVNDPKLGARGSTFSGWHIEEALRRLANEKMVKRLEDVGGDIIQVIDEKRIELEYYKNGVIHGLAPVSLMAAAIRACRPRAADGEASGGMPDINDPDVVRLFELQLFLLRCELTLDPECTVQDLAARSLAQLATYGALEQRADGGYAVVDRGRITELAEATRNLRESYLLALRACVALRSHDIPIDELPNRVKKVGEGLLAVDEVGRPEALSAANLGNALMTFREEGVITVRTEGKGLLLDDQAVEQYSHDLRRLSE
jgi:glycerol-3-phosphate O-acyltransferase